MKDFCNYNQKAILPNNKKEEQHILKSVSAADFITASRLLPILQQKKMVEFGFKAATHKRNWFFDTRPQPAFNRQFELSIKDLKALEGAGYSIYIFADPGKTTGKAAHYFY